MLTGIGYKHSKITHWSYSASDIDCVSQETNLLQSPIVSWVMLLL